MSSIQINLPDELKRFMEAQATSRGFETPSEYVQSLLEEDRLRNMRAEIEEMLLEAVRSPSSPLTQKDWDDIRRHGRALIERRRGA